MAKYPSETLKLWKKAKQLREQYYLDYASAKEKGGIRWSGSAWALDAIPEGLGTDVYLLTGEPYAASIAHDMKFNKQCQDAAESAGFARDLGRNLHQQVSLGRRVPDAGFQLPDPDLLLPQQVVPACVQAGESARVLHRCRRRSVQGP